MMQCGERILRLPIPALLLCSVGAVHGLKTSLGASAVPASGSARPSQPR